MDGWLIHLTKSKNSSSLGTICQSVGRDIYYYNFKQYQGATVGFFIAFIILLPLSSPEFCKKYIYSTPRDVTLNQNLFVNSLDSNTANASVYLCIWNDDFVYSNLHTLLYERTKN